ncbi:tetratricopeptide repeat protein [Prosthecobacter sp.]|uniref:tetratricopeptide repeat protein n=1 Tax=Prosthecobacter sp. TaxID=1965333 RepID=UPI003784F26A
MHFPAFLRLLCVAFTLVVPLSLSSAQTFEELIAKGDIYDTTFEANRALNYYLQAEKLAPENVPLLLRIARQYRYLLSSARSSEEKIRYGNSSLGYGLRAAKLAPSNSEAQLSPAITYGKMLPYESSKIQVEVTPLIKAAADKAIRLDPKNDTAWHVLGRWHQVLANVGAVKRALGGLIYGKLPVTTNEAAVKCFVQAIAINPRRLRHYIELGHTYAQMGNTTEARRYLEKGLAMPNKEHDDPELKTKGRETLAKLPP